MNYKPLCETSARHQGLNKLYTTSYSFHSNDQKQAFRFLSLALASHGSCPLARLSYLAQYVDNNDFADSSLPQVSPDGHQAVEDGATVQPQPGPTRAEKSRSLPLGRR
ncbi:hypothetical protein ASPCAL03706 [Aspergillus calidoustus]|uniref:Uncharacterized protein n=1 Tax=Aspergillus calidoustus TaxID=454130 RepID=A0A0U5C4C9_ASPCI|nr:hypothetical protein ASPCAL03706 [Aspergillus calidoustus]